MTKPRPSLPTVLLALALALALAACGPRPQPANPALWEVEGPAGQKGWLFGTIHSLDAPALWRSEKVDSALGQAGALVVEVAGIADDAAMARTFASLSQSPGQPPLSQRIDPELREELGEVLRKGKMRESQFAGIETWAAALTLARAGGGSLKSAYGIDRAVMDAAQGKRVLELEGAASQLGLFDRLPEKEQRDLLDAVVHGDGDPETESGSLADAWRRGDMRVIEAETHRGILADPELRMALFTQRNRSWTARLAALMKSGVRPFVAVGAAHMAGPEGLPALLAAEGYTVRRVQ